jgi:hypothetical protein
MRATREGPQHRDPQGGSSEGTQRENGRRSGRRPLQDTSGSGGDGRYITRGAAQKSAVAKAGGRYRRPLPEQCPEVGFLSTYIRNKHSSQPKQVAHNSQSKTGNLPRALIGRWPFPDGCKCPFGCNGYVTAVAAGQNQRFNSGMGIFSWYYLSSPPRSLDPTSSPRVRS